MPRQVLALWCAVAIVALLAIAWLGVGSPGSAPSDAGPRTGGSPSNSATGDPSGTPSADASGSASPGVTSPGGTSGTGGSKPDANDPNASSGVEVLPPQPDGGEALPGLDKEPPDTTKALVTKPLPRSSVSKGRLTKGFPRRVLGPSKGSEIVSSSVSPAGDRSLQVALVATTAASADSVLRDFRIRLAKLGFTESAAAAGSTADGSTAASFVRGDDTVVVTATPGSDSTDYTAYGTLHTSGA